MSTTSASVESGANSTFTGRSGVATYASDGVLVSSLLIASGVSVTRSLGIAPSFPLLSVYLLCSAVVPSVSALVLWRTRWGRPSLLQGAQVVAAVAIASVPAIALVALLVSTGGLMTLVGAGMMVFAAGFAVSVAHDLFVPGSGTPLTWAMRIGSILVTPAVVVGAAAAFPDGMEAIQAWANPMVVAGMGSLGAKRVLLYHVSEG